MILLRFRDLAVYKAGYNAQVDLEQVSLSVVIDQFCGIIVQSICQRIVIRVGVSQHLDGGYLIVKVVLFSTDIIDQIRHQRLVSLIYRQI